MNLVFLHFNLVKRLKIKHIDPHLMEIKTKVLGGLLLGCYEIMHVMQLRKKHVVPRPYQQHVSKTITTNTTYIDR